MAPGSDGWVIQMNNCTMDALKPYRLNPDCGNYNCHGLTSIDAQAILDSSNNRIVCRAGVTQQTFLRAGADRCRVAQPVDGKPPREYWDIGGLRICPSDDGSVAHLYSATEQKGGVLQEDALKNMVQISDSEFRGSCGTRKRPICYRWQPKGGNQVV